MANNDQQAQIDELYHQIGQLKVKRDFLANRSAQVGFTSNQMATAVLESTPRADRFALPARGRPLTPQSENHRQHRGDRWLKLKEQ
jgi:hypothetical protein